MIIIHELELLAYARHTKLHCLLTDSFTPIQEQLTPNCVFSACLLSAIYMSSYRSVGFPMVELANV